MNPKSLRQRDLARIHLYKKKLGLDEDTYRALLEGVTGKSSAAAMNRTERWWVLLELTRLDIGARAMVVPDKPQPPPPEKARLLYKIESLLAKEDRPEEYAHAMAKRMFKVDLVQWCDPDQLRRIVAALVYDARRKNAQ
jgi:phage gp16-like protein